MRVITLKAQALFIKAPLQEVLKYYEIKAKVGFGYDNSVSLQTDNVGHVGAAVLANVACIVGLQTNDVRRN